MSNALLSAADLAARVRVGSVDVLDTRSGPGGAGRQAFVDGHIPRARHTDYAMDGWRARIGNAPGMLPSETHLSTLIGRLGLRPDREIMLVPGSDTVSDLAAASRIYWTLKAVGYRPVGLLDGGMPAWIAAGFPVETGAPPFFEGAAPLSIQPSLRAMASDVESALGSDTVLVDGRALSYFEGKEKASESLAAGHIPGALNIDYVTAYDPATRRLRPAAELASLYGKVRSDAPVISYCNTGHTAALNWFVLSEVLGRSGVRLYDGSMTDWTQDPSRPVAR